MNIIVFSKNRAAQLELFIRSFRKYVKNPDNYILKVVHHYTESHYAEGYKKLMNMNYPNVHYIKETNFWQDVVNCIDTTKKYITFFCDDDVFKNPVDFYDEQMKIFNEDKEIACRSLRLHPRLTYCYPMAISMRTPKFMENNIFYWTGQDGDFGYPMSLDGHIFRMEDIYPALVKFSFPNPTMLENMLVGQQLRAPKMICYNKSIIVCNPCNRVQTVCNNIHGNVDTKVLNDNFLLGKLISFQNIDGFENYSCHQEMEIIYERE